MNSINDTNISDVRKQISLKESSIPYWANDNSVRNTITDYDNFPYNRWFRGDYKSSNPIVAEREAGYRIRKDKCYKVIQPETPDDYPDHCFEVPCSTVYPCYPKYMSKVADRNALNLIINKSNILQYR